MQAISVEFGDCVDVGLIFAQKLNNIIVTLVASKMKGWPVVKGFMVDEWGIVVLPARNDMFDLIIQSLLTILPEFLVIFGNIDPKLVPIGFGILNIYVSEQVLCNPTDSRCSTFS